MVYTDCLDLFNFKVSVVPSGNSILTEGTSPTSLSLVKVNFGNDSEEPSAKMLVIISNKILKNKNVYTRTLF